MTTLPSVAAPRLGAIDQYVKAFEAAWVDSGQAAISAFLPPPDDPVYAKAVRELVRVDLEFRWAGGRGAPAPRVLEVDDYRQTFPAVFRDPAALAAVAFE